MWISTATPNLGVRDFAGACLRMQQDVWAAPVRYPTAWASFEANPDKHADKALPGVPVLLWFDHWGTYNGVYGQYGHVATHVPGRGILSSPASGYGQQWFNNIEAIEGALACTYVAWTPSLNGLTVAAYQSEPIPTPTIRKPKMGAFFRNKTTGSIYFQEQPGAKLFLIATISEWSGYAAQGNKWADLEPSDMEKLIKKYGLIVA